MLNIIDIKHFYVKDGVTDGELEPIQVSFLDMIGDSLTKALSIQKHQKDLERMNLRRSN